MFLYVWEVNVKKIALIHDLSGFGRCSLTAAIPVISVLGIQACPIPTAILSAQTGFPNYYCDDFTDRMDYITDEWKEMNVTFDGIYSGYLASPLQIKKVLRFFDTFQGENTMYLVDPVMGDHGRKIRIFTQELLDGMKELILRADVITPNLTELCLLADEDYAEIIRHQQKQDYLQRLENVCKKLLKRALKKQIIIVTGIIREENGQEYVGNLAVSHEETFYLETPYTGMGFSGTGDLFASVICGSMVNGLSIQEAIKKATDFLQEAIEDASKEKIASNHGVYFEKYLKKLL